MSLKTHDIAIIGTGFAGLGAAIRLQQEGFSDFVLLEKSDEVGGTWRDNTYPGCACDVQSHLYSFSFEPNPDWSRMFARQPEILDYLKHCARKYHLYPKVRFHTEVTGASWDEDAAVWTVSGPDGAILRARKLVSGMGGLSRPAYPQIKGLENFQGQTFHSQQWNHDYPLSGKRVAVIGTGASAIQFVPQIAGRVARLDLYQRTPPWILPKPDRAIRAAERTLFRLVPRAQEAIRNALYWQFEARAAGFVVNPRIMKLPERWARSHIRNQIPDRALRRRVTPDYTIGCKRILISNDYYPALTRDNVNLLTDGIREITATGIIDTQGVEREVDAIIFGTGFAATDPIGTMRITGRDGRDLKETVTAKPEAYLGTTIAGFPNLFFLTGPNTGLGHNSLIYMIESQVEYLLQAFGHMREQGLRAIEVREKVQDRFNAGLRSKLGKAVWSAGGCRSWYLDEQGRNITLWPDFTWRFRQMTARFRSADYAIDTGRWREPLPRAA